MLLLLSVARAIELQQDTCKKSKCLVKVFRSLHIVLQRYLKIRRPVRSKICPIKIHIPFMENNSMPLAFLHNTIYCYHKQCPPGRQSTALATQNTILSQEKLFSKAYVQLETRVLLCSQHFTTIVSPVKTWPSARICQKIPSVHGRLSTNSNRRGVPALRGGITSTFYAVKNHKQVRTSASWDKFCQYVCE